MPTESVCKDCGLHVTSYGDYKIEITRCSVCAWITEYISPDEQLLAREILDVPIREKQNG